MEVLARRLLTKAAQKIGGSELLAKHLGVSTSTLRQWMSTSTLQQWMNGEAIPPAEVLHKAADLVLDDKT
jgi:transcriptional regulator with XRE-family HTH domain